MAKRAGALLAVLAAAAGIAGAQPNAEVNAALARWELLRASPDLRLSIDPKTLRSKGNESSFKYLIDFRRSQGEVGGQYRSIVVGARLRCNDRRIALDTYELYAGSTATGVLIAQPAPSAKEKTFQPIEKGSSDEELYQRVCGKGTVAPK